MTGTWAINAQHKFHDFLGDAYTKVASGAFNYQSAVSSAIDDLAQQGVTVFSYKTGRNISIEAAVLMNVRTSMHDLADGRKQLAAYQERAKHYPIISLNFQSPVQVLEKYLGVM